MNKHIIMSHNDRKCSKCPEIKLKDDKAFKNHLKLSSHRLKTKHCCSSCKFQSYFETYLWEHMLKDHKNMKNLKKSTKVKKEQIKEDSVDSGNQNE